MLFVKEDNIFSVKKNLIFICSKKKKKNERVYINNSHFDYIIMPLFLQEILKQASYCTEIEIKPHYVVPDTNCFIDHLPELEKLIHSFSNAQEHTCTLMIPTVGMLNTYLYE